MASFKEFLEDYEKKENERADKFLKRLEAGKVLSDEMYPPKSRFIKLKEPIAYPVRFSVWSVVPFYGSTIIFLDAMSDRKKFDEYCNKTLELGFTSRDIDEIIDLVKNTGRIQFALKFDPTSYKNLEFLEPLFRELEPPIFPNPLPALIGEKYKEYCVEFDTLAGFGFDEYLWSFCKNVGMDEDENYSTEIFRKYISGYATLKFLGYDELVEEIGCLMITDYSEADKWFELFGSMIAVPSLVHPKGIFNFSKEELIDVHELGEDYGIKTIPCEIGKFILEKLVRYPETLDGCWEIMQHYDDNELYKVLNALNEGVKERKVDIIEDKRDNITEILDNVWKETDKINWKADIARLSVGLVGGLSANLSGIGILAGLGFSGIDKMVGLKMDSIGEKMAKVFSPNYLVTIYDFKKRHNMQK